MGIRLDPRDQVLTAWKYGIYHRMRLQTFGLDFPGSMASCILSTATAKPVPNSKPRPDSRQQSA